MRPVNLLPARYRPRAAGEESKTAYMALGALALLLLAVFGYVMTARSVNSGRSGARWSSSLAHPDPRRW